MQVCVNVFIYVCIYVYIHMFSVSMQERALDQ